MATRDGGLPGSRPHLDAARFTRRRVIGSLVRPGTQLPDRDTPRPLRMVVGSAGVAAMALGVAGVLGVFRPGAPSGWRGDLITDGQGTRYVIVDGRLHPVLNLASARLILGKDMKKADVPDSVLAPLKAAMGSGVGIPGAPESLPAARDLDLKSWSLCSATSPDADVPGKAVLEIGYPASSGVLGGVSSVLVQEESGGQYVIDGGMKYKVQDRNVLVAFNVPTLKPRLVKAAWLSGLPSGDPLGVPGLAGTFGAAVKHPAPVGFNKVGMFGKTVAVDGTTAYYLVSGDGLTPVSLTTYELYQRDPRLVAAKFTETVLAQNKIAQDMLAPSSPGLTWPSEPPRFEAASQNAVSSVLCVAFGGVYDPEGRAELAVSVAPGLPHPLTSVEASLPAPSGQGAADVVVVEVGHGVVAHDHDSGTGETSVTYLVTDARARFALVGGTSGAGGPTGSAGPTGSGPTAVHQLGYESAPTSDVPESWLRLLPFGPALDPSKAAQVQP